MAKYVYEQLGDGEGFELVPLGEANGVEVFTQLDDVPSSYAGQGLKVVRVNTGATALEFSTPNFLILSDTPDSYTSAEGKHILVNSAGTALEFNYPTGVIDGSESANGKVGEYRGELVPLASAVPLITNTAKTITFMPLSAGDWEINGSVKIDTTATTSISRVIGGIGIAPNALPTDYTTGFAMEAFVPGASFLPGIACATRRLNLTSTTYVYLIGFANFSVSTAAAYGLMQARRIR